MNEIRINSTDLPIREYNGQRVVTFKDIDTVHERKDGTARRNYYTNKERFIEGVDYFVRNSYEAQNEFGVVAPNGLTLMTESGYLMLAKSFTDDLAWKVQRKLVNNYFRGKSPEPDPEPEQLTLETSKYHYFPKTFKGEPVITIADFEHFTGVVSDSARWIIYKSLKLDDDYINLNKRSLAKFKTENPNIKRSINRLTVIKASGVKKLLKYFKQSVEIPMIAEKKAESTQIQVPEAQMVNTDECIVALNVLRYLKHAQENWREEYMVKGDKSMVERCGKDISSIDRVIKSVGAFVAAGY